MGASFGPSVPRSGGAWARLELVRGESTGRQWSIDARTPQIRVSVGSAPDAGWSVRWPGVHAHHFELFWDGQALWVADLKGAGDVVLNGTRVFDWTQVAGNGELTFGGAALRIETSAPPTHDMASEPGEAALVVLAPIDPGMSSGTLAPRSELPVASWDDSSLVGEPTRIAPPPAADPPPLTGPGWGPLEYEKTRVVAPVAPAPVVGPAAPGSPVPAGEPMLSALRPRLGNAGGSAPPVAVPMSPPAAMPGPVATPASIPAGFAAPPYAGDPGAVPGPAKTQQSLPTRTWVLLIVTVLAAAGVMLVEGPIDTSMQADSTQSAPDASADSVPTSAEAASASTRPEPVPAVDARDPAVARPVAPDHAVTLGPGAERAAADLVIAGRFADALPHYLRLAAAHPERPEFAEVARILERRLAARCRGGVGPDGRPCGPR